MIQYLSHYGIHFLLPLIVALLFFRSQWQKAYFTMLIGLIIDLDHVLATPMFDAHRCSIGFHPLHSAFPILCYAFLCYPKTSRLLGIGLMIHILADTVDCMFMR